MFSDALIDVKHAVAGISGAVSDFHTPKKENYLQNLKKIKKIVYAILQNAIKYNKI